jgi:moderate conductance mechanosensitive channel
MDLSFTPEIAKDSFFIALTLLFAILVSSVLRSFIRVPKGLENKRGNTFASVLKSAVSVIVYAIALHVIFGILDINVAPLLASVGIVGLAVGMGARPLIEDLIGGMTILAQSEVAIGEEVEVDGSVGKIEKINLRTLTLRAKDGSVIIIPNSLVKKVIIHAQKQKGSKKA